MTSENAPELTDVPPPLKAAMVLWEHLAAYAWEQTIALGRGVVLALEDELLRSAERYDADGTCDLPLSFVPMLEVPSGDDFLHVIRSYDMKRQVVLLVGQREKSGAEDSEQLYVLEANEQGRPTPEECYFALHKGT